MSDILKISDVKKAIELLNTKGVTREKVLILQGDTFENALTTYARMCVEAEKKSAGWVKTADRMPTEADGIEWAGGQIAVLAMTNMAHGYFPEVKAVEEFKGFNPCKYFPYWMPIPKLPEVEA